MQIASAEPYKGFSAYAAMHERFPCSRYLQLAGMSERPVMAVLYGTFGRNSSCIKRFAHKFRNKPHLIEIHPTNETCRHAPRICLKGEVFKNLRVQEYNGLLEAMPEYAKVKLLVRLKRIVDITALGNSFTTWVLSTGLEDSFTRKAYENIVSLYRENWPFLIARSSTSDVAYTRGADFNELHTATARFGKKPCIWNQDGLSGGQLQAASLFERFANCDVLIGWTERSQGIGKVWTYPRKRSFELSNSDIDGYGRIISAVRAISK
jgi:hypothetical protein